MKSILFLIVSTSLIFSPVAHAQEAVPIEAGESAPFSGTLLSNEAAASLLAEIKTCAERSTAQLEFQIESNTAKCDLDKSLLQIQVDSQKSRYESIILSQDAQLDYMLKSNSPKLSKEATFIIGVVSGVILTTAAAYSISSVANIN
jgi:hypothetical protein